MSKIDFYGPDGEYQTRVNSAANAAELTRINEEVSVSQLELTDQQKQQWSILQFLATIKIGNPDNDTVIQCIHAIDRLNGTNNLTFQPTDSLCERYGQSLSKLGIQTGHPWTPGLLSVVDHVHTHTHTHVDASESNPIIEKTPLFLAFNKNAFTCLIVAERLPGRTDQLIITPDWWKLGLLPVKSNNKGLMHSLHEAMQWVYKVSGTSRPYRIRWWLEKIEAFESEQWPTSIHHDCESAMAAAACLAQSLLTRKHASTQALLDPKMGISAELICLQVHNDEKPLSKFGCKTIKNALEKYKSADIHQLHGMVFPTGQTGIDIKKEQKETLILQAPTLDEAYDKLCFVSSDERATAKIVKEQWPWTALPTPKHYPQ
jgi:hypothetical protein